MKTKTILIRGKKVECRRVAGNEKRQRGDVYDYTSSCEGNQVYGIGEYQKHFSNAAYRPLPAKRPKAKKGIAVKPVIAWGIFTSKGVKAWAWPTEVGARNYCEKGERAIKVRVTPVKGKS